MRTIVKYRLGQALVQLASDTVMFFCCESGGERISRHNALRDALFDRAVAAGLRPTKEGREGSSCPAMTADHQTCRSLTGNWLCTIKLKLVHTLCINKHFLLIKET